MLSKNYNIIVINAQFVDFSFSTYFFAIVFPHFKKSSEKILIQNRKKKEEEEEGEKMHQQVIYTQTHIYIN